MKNLSKQVVILDNISSPFIHQAIIILKDYSPENHEKIIMEAEKIVSSYFQGNCATNEKNKKSTNSNIKLKSLILFLSLALIGSVSMLILK